jgi:NADPH2:quinone reductase
MTTTMQAVMLTRKGGPEVLETVELPLPEPGPGELRVRVLATGVGATDVTMRRGSYPYAPKLPFVPGYESVGEVEALGPGVSGFAPGDRVGALLVHGGYATHVVRRAEDWVKLPPGLDPAEAVALILNYGTAYQMIHRTVGLAPGQTALVNAANGGVGQALLDLLRAHGVRAIGAAATARHDLVRSYGAEPVEGRSGPYAARVRALVPGGVDAAFDAIGGAASGEARRATARGGTLVWYGFMGAGTTGALLRTAGNVFAGAPLTGKRGRFYGITLLYRKDPRPLREDLARLFALLAEGRIRPRIAERLPLLAARRANERLEAGAIEGKLVLVA